MRNLMVALILVVLAAPVFGGKLSTDVITNGGGEGAFFDVTAGSHGVKVTGFEATIVGDANARVYYKVGSFAGAENDAGAWTLLGSQAVAGGSGFIQDLYSIDPGATVAIPANQTYGFLIYTGFTGTGSLAVRVDTQNDVIVANADIRISAGASSFGGDPSVPFDGSLASRVFRGSVIYDVLPTPAIPALSQWALIALAMALAGMGAMTFRRRPS